MLDAATIGVIVDQVVNRMKETASEPQPAPQQSVQPPMDFSALMEDAVDTRHEELGQLHPDIQLSGLPLGAALKPAVKMAIWDGKYVDFQLLQDDITDDDDKFVIQANADSSFAIRKNNKGKKITTFEQWLRSFLVFASVMTEKFPHAAPGLFKYLSMVQAMHQRITGPAWLDYDKQFRKLKQVDPSKVWGKLEPEIHLMATMPMRNQPFRSQSSRQPNKSESTPKGYCYHFARGITCPRMPACQYQHKCYKCSGNHAAKNCNAVS